jgi:hypothetical protein
VGHEDHIIQCPQCRREEEESWAALTTQFLFSDPSFWSGVSRILDLGCTFDAYNYSQSDEEADTKAAYSDWSMVGSDLLASMSTYGR